MIPSFSGVRIGREVSSAAVFLAALLATASSLTPRWAIAAEPQYLLGIAADEAQNIYLADRNLPGVWKLTDGKLSLLFGGSKKFRTPLNAVRCLAIDKEGKLLAGDSATREVYRFGDDKQPVPLTGGQIGIPTAIAVRKNGDLVVADLELHRVWTVPAAGGKPEVFATVSAPRGLAVDAEDRVWVLCPSATPLYRSTPDGKLETVIKERTFEFPSALVLDAAGNAYVCDTYAKAVWKIPPGQPPVKWASGEPLVSPTGLAWQGDQLLVVDPRAKAVIRVDAGGKMGKIEFALAEP